MSHCFQSSVFTPNAFGRLVAVAILNWLVALAPAVRAAEEYGNSLDWVPADASVYSASLRLKEQFDIVAESNAWKKFRAIPSVEMAWQMAEMQINNPNGPAAMFWQLMEAPENKQLAKLLGEMFSEEVVFYAGEDFSKFVELMQVVQGSKIAPIIQAARQAGSDLPDESAQMEVIIQSIVDDPALAEVPQMVFAFQVDDSDAAEAQLKRLEAFANMALEQVELGAKFEREELSETEFIVLTLNGSMIPWDDEVPMGFPGDEDAYQEIKEIVSEKELAVALGVWNDYVVLSIGRSTEHLESLGEGEVIGSREEFEPLAEYRDEKLVSLQYVSREFVQQNYFNAKDLDEIVAEIDAVLEDAEEMPEELKDRIGEDLPELAADMKKYLGKPGPVAGFQFLTDSGFEGYSYNWSTSPGLDGSKELELLQHVGGSPIIAVVARGKEDPEAYDMTVKWLGKALGYFEDFALEQMDDDEREHAEEALEMAKPLLSRLDKATREHLIPALADGQTAIVFDADIASKQWHEEMPKSFAELPMLEFAIVLGVSDADEFKEAMTEYWKVAEDALAAIREKAPDAIPEDYEIPAPQEESTAGGTVFRWELPKESGLDEQIAPSGALGDHVAAFATSPALAERVLKEQAPTGLGKIGEANEPRAVVGGIDFAELITAISPWVEFGIRASHDEALAAKDPAEDPDDLQEVLSQVRDGLVILKCFRGAWMETREEDGAWVTHSVTTFEDVAE